MKDLNEFGVQELNVSELKEVEGGGLFTILLGCTVAYFLGRWL